MAKTSKKSEYRYMLAKTIKVTCVQHLLEYLREKIKCSILMHDNESAINIIINLIHHGQTKHIEFDK